MSALNYGGVEGHAPEQLDRGGLEGSDDACLFAPLYTLSRYRIRLAVQIHNADRGVDMEQEVVIEIRAAEGGEDAKLLVLDQFRAYGNVARRHCL